MKKLLALGLSMAMMASLSAVAFAEETVSKDNLVDNKATRDVVVSTTVEGVEDAEWFEVNIPANITFNWKSTDPQTRKVSITGQLFMESTVSVDATINKVMKLTTDEGTDESKVLNYTATKDAYNLDMMGGTTSAEESIDFSVTDDQWQAAKAVGTYMDTITFNISYANTSVAE